MKRPRNGVIFSPRKRRPTSLATKEDGFSFEKRFFLRFFRFFPSLEEESRGGLQIALLLSHCFELGVRDLINFVKSNATTWIASNYVKSRIHFFFLSLLFLFFLIRIVNSVCL